MGANLYAFQAVRLETEDGELVREGHVFKQPRGKHAKVVEYGSRRFIIHSTRDSVHVYRECYSTGLIREEE